jgi:hypothetical protein
VAKKINFNLSLPGKFLLFFFIFIFGANLTLAADPIVPTVQIHLGGFSGWTGENAGWQSGSNYCPNGTANGVQCLQISWIGQYISVLYNYGIGLAAALAIVMIMVGGLVWLLSAGSPDKVGKAKEFIASALSGLLLALFAVMILTTINPNLVNLKGITVTGVNPRLEGITNGLNARISATDFDNGRFIHVETPPEINRVGMSATSVLNLRFYDGRWQYYYGGIDARTINDGIPWVDASNQANLANHWYSPGNLIFPIPQLFRDMAQNLNNMDMSSGLSYIENMMQSNRLNISM